jgi:hypothetical protein
VWYLILPDLLVYFTIFFGGVLTGGLLIVMVVLFYLRDGGSIRIQCTNEDNPNLEDF